MDKLDSQTRGKILRSALKHFAECGYAGASVQAIVDAARVTKPTLYYYFKSKAGLFQALIDWAHDERYRLMCEASEGVGELSSQLTEVLAALFEFINGNRSLMRIYGMMTIKVMEHLLHGKPRLTRRDAESIVQLFLGGAAVHR